MTIQLEHEYNREDIVTLRLGVEMKRCHSWSDWWIKRCPNDPNRVLIKRIIALEGDTVRIRLPCPEPEIKIPQGHVWVEGMLLSSLARPKLRAAQRRWIFSFWWQQFVWTHTSGSYSIEAYQDHLASRAFWPSQRTRDSWKSQCTWIQTRNGRDWTQESSSGKSENWAPLWSWHRPIGQSM